MEQTKTITKALLHWTQGVYTLFNDSAIDETQEVHSLSDLQFNKKLLCALQTILVQEGDESFVDTFKKITTQKDSEIQRLHHIILSLEQKYGQKFEELHLEVDETTDTSYNTEQIRKIVELTLGWAMLFGQEEQRQKYIEHIFTLSTDLQQALMLIIQEQQQMASVVHATNNDNDDTFMQSTPKGSSQRRSSLASSPTPNRDLTASAFSRSDSPYKRLATQQAITNSLRKKIENNTLSTPGNNQTIDKLRKQLHLFKEENIRLHSEVSEAQNKLAEHDEERAKLTECSEKRAAELKKVMHAEMKAIERETELRASIQDLQQRNNQLMQKNAETNLMQKEMQRLQDENAILSTVRVKT